MTFSLLSKSAWDSQEESDEEEEAPKAAPKRKADKQKVDAEVCPTALHVPRRHHSPTLFTSHVRHFIMSLSYVTKSVWYSFSIMLSLVSRPCL